MQGDRLYPHHVFERCGPHHALHRAGRLEFMASRNLFQMRREAAWRNPIGRRFGACDDVLIHDCIEVDLDAVWNVASSRIPEIQAAFGSTWNPQGVESGTG